MVAGLDPRTFPVYVFVDECEFAQSKDAAHSVEILTVFSE
jgi:hypothetical protein